MKKIWKKAVACFLALALVTGASPVNVDTGGLMPDMSLTAYAAEPINLSTLTGNYTANDGDVLTGTLGGNYKISIADGATVTLNDVTINGTNDKNYSWAGITCEGDATIILSGTNIVKGFWRFYPGISVPAEKTLTIKGSGSLTASPCDDRGTQNSGAGIGAYYRDINIGTSFDCGNIVIEGGTINATGGLYGAGIGGAFYNGCGNITITGGTVTATGGKYAPGIGGGYKTGGGNITITGGTITTTGGEKCPGIGAQRGSFTPNLGDITITDGVTSVTATGGNSAPYSIGASDQCSCGTITIGGTVTGNISTNPYTYPLPHTHSFTYTDDGDTITATCGAEDCPLENRTATLTIAPSSTGGYGAALSGDAAEFGVTDSDIEYSSDGENWSKTVPTTSGSYQARIVVTDKTDSTKTCTATVSYGVYTITTDKAYTTETDHGTVSVPTAAAAGTTVTITTAPDAGYELESLTVTKAGGGTVEVTKDGNNGTFTMPEGAVTVSATFIGKPVTASLSVTGNTGTTCTAKLLNSSYEEIDSVTKKGGEQFILLVNRDEGYDFNVTYGTDSPVTLTEFTKEEYEAYVAYAKDNNITLSPNMVLAWVTMPGVTDDSVTLTVDFSKLQTFTILYQPTGNPDNVWCKFAVNSGVDGNNTASSQMKSDATMGDGSQVYSLKVTVGFAPTSVAFAATKDAVDAVADNNMTGCSTKTDTSEWTTITGGKFVIIGGDAKTVIVAFVSDANNMAVYNSDTVEVDEGTGTDGVTYRVAIVTDGSTGTVTAPANTLTKDGYDFAGWRGFEGTAPHKTEKIYNAGDSISVSENTTLNAVWNLKKSTVTLNLNGGTGNNSVEPVTYGEKLPTLETPTRSGFAFDGWKVSKAVTENGVAFAKGSPFDLNTPITANLNLTAQWKHVHSYSCYRISTFGNALAAYAEYDSAIHVAICGCNDIQLMAHEFDENGKCACGYQKPEPDVTLNISYGQWSNGAYTEKMKGMPETAKQGQEVSICAPDAWGDLQFSKWQYSTDNSTWYDQTADAYASFLIPATMYVRALYVNPVTVPQVDLSARQYDDHTVVNGQTYTMDNILFQMNYKLPDGCTFVDAGVRMGDNAGISYYELKEITYTANSETKALVKGFAALGVLVSVDPTNARFAREADSSETKTFYEVHKNSVLDEMSAATLAKYMYESKPINVEKYDPIYWEAKAKTKGMSGSINTLPPLKFAQKDNQNHYIYGIGWLRYKDSSGNIKTIYTDALPATVNKIPANTVTKTGN